MLASWSFHPRNSLMERIDPRARWIFSLAFLFAITAFWDARCLVFFVVTAVLWYVAAGVKWSETKRAWLLVGTILFVMIVVNTILTGGGAGGIVPPGGKLVFPDGFTLFGMPFHFGLTYQRLWFALCQLMRILPISAVFIIIPFSMDPRLYGVAFRRLGLPDKVAYTMDLAFRYVPTLSRDFNTTLDAQRARGYEVERLSGGLIQQIARIAPLIVPVTMNSILTGEDVTNAMDLRCFGVHPRTWLIELQYHWFDIAIVVFAVAILITSIYLPNFAHVGDFWVPEWFLALGG